MTSSSSSSNCGSEYKDKSKFKSSLLGRVSSLMKEQRQDLRSLATFRILFGLYILYDILSRLQHGRLSLLWYTSSSSSSSSFLHANDTPHRSPIHLIWFYRGSELFQLCLFALTAILALMYTLGYSYLCPSSCISSSCCVKVLLWLNVTAMQCRNMHVHDGSDTFSRHLLLWSCFLPMNKVWSLDAYLQRRRICNATSSNTGSNATSKSNSKIICNQKHQQLEQYQHQQKESITENKIAVWGIRLQIVFMYLGTVLSRTTDIYGYNIQHLSESEWLPPSLTAVYYSLNASFSTRDNVLGDFVRHHFTLTQIMTFSAMLIEGLAPIACLIMGVGVCVNLDSTSGSNRNSKTVSTTTTSTMTTMTTTIDNKYAFIPLFLLFKLHFGLLILMNLPNWQFVGMIATTIWIPTSIWDKWQRKLSIFYPHWVSPPGIQESISTRLKKDIDNDIDHGKKVHVGDSSDSSGKNSDNSRNRNSNSNRRVSIKIKNFLTYFFFTYMIYNFAGERRWIAKHDGGDIGEFLRFSQYWVMFSRPSKTSTHDIFTGMVVRVQSKNDIDNDIEEIEEEVDVWRWMTDGQLVGIDLESRREEIWTNMTHVYPSPRLERVFSQWSGKRNTRALKYFLDKICNVGPFNELTFIWQNLIVTGSLEFTRYSKAKKDDVFHVNCK